MKSTILLVLLISVYVCASPSYFQDAGKWKNYVSTLEISKGLVSGSLKDTHEAIVTLANLGSSFTTKQNDEFCSNVRQTLEKKSDIESIYYASSIAKILKCSLKDVRVEGTIKKALSDSNSVEELYFAVVAGSNLKALEVYQLDDSLLQEAVITIDSFGEVDGTVANKKSEWGTVYHSGLAFEALAIIKENVKLDEEEDSIVSAFAENAVTLLKEKINKAKQGSAFYDRGDSRGAFKVSYSFLNGANKLFAANGDSDLSVSLTTTEAVAEYILAHQPERLSLDNLYYYSQLLRIFSDGTVPKPLVLNLLQSSVESSKGSDSSIKVKITDLLGNPVERLVVFLMKATSNQKAVANNVQLHPVKGSSGEYECNLPSLRSEQGLYSLEFGASTEEKKSAITQAVRTLKVLSTINVGVVDLRIVDSGDRDSFQTVSASEGKPFQSLKTSYFYTLSFSFQVKNQLNKQLNVQQAFVRLAGAKSSITVPAKLSESSYKVDINLKNYGQELLFHTGEYTVELIIGDSFVLNPKAINLGTVRIDFPKNMEDKIKPKENVYTVKNEIEHKFRVPEPRPDKSVSFAFTLAVLAPFLILLFSLLIIGTNIRIPSGLGLIANLVFSSGIIAIFTLYGWFWYELNMFQTLGYLGPISVATILAGNLALRIRHASAKKQKTE